MTTSVIRAGGTGVAGVQTTGGDDGTLSLKVGPLDATVEALSISSTGLLTIADDLMIKDGGTIGVASTNDALTISSAGLLTVKDDLVIKSGGTIGGANDPDLLTIGNAVLTVAGEVVGTGFTGTLDGILGSGTAAAATTTTLASTTITASGIIKTDDTTAATSTTDGSLQTDGGLSVAADAVIDLALVNVSWPFSKSSISFRFNPLL